jgi:hypothetical protein
MEFSVLASSTPWQIISDLVGFGTVGMLMTELEGLTRPELDERARSLGLDPSAYSTKQDVIDAIAGVGEPAAA